MASATWYLSASRGGSRNVMPRIKILPPAPYLHACFIYTPETGDLIWRDRPRDRFANARAWARCNTMFAHKPAGSIDKLGYIIVLLEKVPYKAHRIAWKLMAGTEPPAMIDHINGDRADNRWANLRGATPFEQVGNQGLHRTNTSGYRGVSAHKSGKWVAQLGRRYLGYFNTPEEAAVVYDAAARERYGEFYGGTYHDY
jgi:hypothetical protein